MTDADISRWASLDGAWKQCGDVLAGYGAENVEISLRQGLACRAVSSTPTHWKSDACHVVGSLYSQTMLTPLTFYTLWHTVSPEADFTDWSPTWSVAFILHG